MVEPELLPLMIPYTDACAVVKPPQRQKANLNPNFRKRLFQVLGIGSIPLGVGLCFVQVPVSCACGNPAIANVGTFLRAQQAYFEENKTFGQSYSELGLTGMPRKTTRYEYSFEVERDRAVMYATPQVVPTDLFRLGLTKAKIGGVVGLVVHNSKVKTTQAVLCVANQATSGKPPQPQFDGKNLTCPEGFVPRR